MQYLGRTALSKRIFTGRQPRRLGKLVVELAGAWMAAEESRLRERRGHERMRAPGAGPDHELVFVDRVVVTLVALRFQLPHAALAELYRVDRSTVTRAIREIRPLLAARGFAVPGHPTCDFVPWRTSSPMPPPRASSCALTAPRSRSAARARTSRAVARTSRARRR
jgi:hypothetical protein